MKIEKVLILGSGGREYSIGLALKKEKNIKKIFFATGNGATEKLGENISITDFEELAQFAKYEKIDLTIVGPEQPLVNGVVDVFKKHGLRIFGSSKGASQLEGSKVFMKNFLKKYNIPTAKFIETSSLQEAYNFIENMNLPIVIKADGLCAGKGVIITQSVEEAKRTTEYMLNGNLFGKAGETVIIEEFLNGYELSVFVISDGNSYKILPAVQDHKKLLDEDNGPNTGGMGAYAPTPLINDELYTKIENKIIKPTLKGMEQEGHSFEGVLFIGLMIINQEPVTLEFNVRFGDPECEILMPLIETPISELLYMATEHRLNEVDIKISNKFAVGVVMASENYPYKSSSPAEIFIDEVFDKNLKENSYISFAGVKVVNRKLYATGGRVLIAIGLGETIKKAKYRAYSLCEYIHFNGQQFRTDIAYQALS